MTYTKVQIKASLSHPLFWSISFIVVSFISKKHRQEFNYEENKHTAIEWPHHDAINFSTLGKSHLNSAASEY